MGISVSEWGFAPRLSPNVNRKAYTFFYLSNDSDALLSFFMQKTQRIHIGQIIEQEIRRQGRSIPWVAQQLNCERTNVYSIFRRESVDTTLLLQISVILQHDFFHYYVTKYNELLSK